LALDNQNELNKLQFEDIGKELAKHTTSNKNLYHADPLNSIKPTNSTPRYFSINITNKMKKLIVNTSTKSQLSHEEARMNASGGNVNSLITMTHQSEMTHGQALEKTYSSFDEH
jgi:hypothetical protein